VKFRANRAFGYGGKARLVGEVFDRMFLINDEKLTSEQFRYASTLDEYELKQITQPCELCGRQFASPHYYDAHMPVAHSGIVLEEEKEPARPVTKLEDEFPSGMVIDAKTGKARGA